jgi:ABC-2 type transport system permease protein
MDLEIVWTVASKDFAIFRRKNSIIYSMTGFILLISVGFPYLIKYINDNAGGDLSTALPTLMNAFSFWFVIGSTIVPVGIASYSLIGEKLQKSLEPLLATPATDREILLGKVIAAFLPSVLLMYGGAAVYMTLMDAFTRERLGYLYYPNWSMGLTMLVAVPLACILSVEMNVMISSRSNDARTAQQLGSLVTVPMGLVYVLSEINFIQLDTGTLLIISGILFVVDAFLYYLSTSTFQREQILTKWK